MTDGMTKGKTQLGIYEWEDGTLRFSFASPGTDRPADFTSKSDDGRTVSVWKRLRNKMGECPRPCPAAIGI
jgi:hypothetical protein